MKGGTSGNQNNPDNTNKVQNFAEKGDSEEVKNLSQTTESKIQAIKSLLQIAIQKSNISTLFLALKALSKLSYNPREILRKALYLSVCKGSDEKTNNDIFDILIKNGALVDGCAAFSSLHEAINKADFTMVKKLAEAGADLNSPFEGLVPLQLALFHQNTEIFDFLLGAGANPDACPNYLNLSDFIHYIQSMKDISEELIQHVENKIGFCQEHLDEIAKNFEDILQKEFLLATQRGKKLLPLLGESHYSFKIDQIKKRLLPIVMKFGINTLFIEYPHNAIPSIVSGEINGPNRSIRNLLVFAQETLKLQLKGVDNHPLRSNKLLPMEERNRVMVDCINSGNQAGLFITGASHLLGLLTDPVAKINLDTFHIVPFNLSRLVKDPRGESLKILHNYLYPQDDDMGKFKKNPSYVIQISEDLTFSSPEEVSAFWNFTSDPAAKVIVDIPNTLSEIDLEILKKDPDQAMTYALQKKSLDLIILSLKIGADVPAYLYFEVTENNIGNVVLLHIAGVDMSTSYDDSTMLHEAVRCGYLDMVKLLILLGVDTKIRDKDGKTAAELASDLRFHEIYESIISSAKTKNLKPKNFAFRFVAANGQLNLVKHILSTPENEISDEDKELAFKAATENGHFDVTHMLLYKCPTLRNDFVGKQLWEALQLEKELVFTLAHCQKTLGIYLPPELPGRIFYFTPAFQALKERVPALQTPFVEHVYKMCNSLRK